MALGGQYFLRCSWSMGDILVVDSILLIPILGFAFLLYMIIKDVWF